MCNHVSRFRGHHVPVSFRAHDPDLAAGTDPHVVTHHIELLFTELSGTGRPQIGQCDAAPAEVPASETPEGAADAAEATETVTAEDAGKSEA